MRQKSLISLVLCAAILASLLPVGAVSDPWSYTEELTGDLEFTTGVFDDGERQEEHYVTYRPSGYVRPYLWYGLNSLGEKNVFETAASQVEAEGKRVLAGINGDYFVLSTGQPVGLVIHDGRLITSDDGNPALGFLADGSAFFGTPQLQTELGIHGAQYRLSGINRSIGDGGFFLYTRDYGLRTPVSKSALNLILIPEDNVDLAVGGETDLKVESVIQSDGSIPIPEDRWVLCLTANSEAWQVHTLESLSAGENVTLRITSADPRWAECTSATGSLYKLITKGMITEDLDRTDKSRAPRTAVGIREDGTILLYTIDGRQSPYSAGISLNDLAKRLLELGCFEAGALDGGGSTVIYAQSAGDEDASARSRPSNGRERDVSTFLMLVTDGAGSGIGKTLSLRSDASVLLCGGSLRFSVGICDETGAPVPSSGYTWSTSDGEISSDGLYTAPAYACRAEICAAGSGLQGSTSVEVIKTPDSIRLLAQDSREELTRLELQPGESVDLTAAANWRLMEIQSEDEQFIWTCTGSAGTIDASGRYTASNNGGIGTITVRAGEASMTIGVFVKTVYTCVQSFEEGPGGNSDGINWSPEHAPDRVRFGEGSLRIDYDLSAGEALLPVQWNQRERAQYLYLWVYGDGSGSRLSAVIGNETVPLITLDFRGWKLLQTNTGYRGLDALLIQGQGSGQIWLDQAVVSNDDTPDLEPPQIELDAYGALITAKVVDLADGPLEAEKLHLTIDGRSADFSYDPISGTLKAEAEDDGQLHRVTLSARDRSGNLASASVMLQGTTSNPFADMRGHWAEEYAGYLYGRGIIAGRDTAEGLLFDPNTAVTRAEFAVLLSRWLGLNGSEADTQEFADADRIPDWARDSIYAVSSLGLILGEREGNNLWFKPLEPLTRAQAATILGRTLEGGRQYADIVFKDADTIPTWAAPYISLMCFMGVFNGFEDGTFRPEDTLTRAQAAKLLTTMS